MNFKNTFQLLAVLTSLFFGQLVYGQPVLSKRQACHAVTSKTCELAHALGRGVNMGNMLEAPLEGDWGLRLETDYIDIAKGKFTTIRIPVRWSNHATETGDATLDELFVARVTKSVDTMLSKGFYVILNMHHYSQIFGDKLQSHEFAVDSNVLDARFINIWRQLAIHYKDKSPKLIFELLNEPHDRINGDSWNQLAAKALAVVRESNPTRTVMIGPGNYNSITELGKLRLPADKNLIVSIHNYDPFHFTHQGASWLPFKLPTGVMCCSAQQRKEVTDKFDMAVDWNMKNGYPLHLGEFGSLRNINNDSREAHARMIRNIVESRSIGWTYWEFGAGFGMYSPENNSWIEPLRRALLD